jgi:hypothetical protein
VDEREVYLARLVRDLGLPVSPIAAQLCSAPWEEFHEDNAFDVALGVLEALARSGSDTAVDAVRGYVADGGGWLSALQTVARSWPVEWWDDLRSVARVRLGATGGERPRWRSLPWTRWADSDERIAAEVRAFSDRPQAPRPFADTSGPALLGLLRDPETDRCLVLDELRRRPPDPLLLELVEDLPVSGLNAFAVELERLGLTALPAARRWAAVPEHSLRWTALRLLAAHGDSGDTRLLIEGLEWLDSRPGDLCGYHDLVTGLARIGGSGATALLPRLEALWRSPHSYERAAYLGALVRLDPTGLPRQLFEGLWDCEADVRRLAAERVPVVNRTRERLRYLRDDPIETEEVRAVAAARLN